MQTNQIFVDEHGGNRGNKTNIERLWDSFNAPYEVRTIRNTIYATHSHMTSTMLRYKLTPFTIDSQNCPNIDWVRENALMFIRDESPNLLLSETFESINVSPQKIYTNSDFLESFVNASEWTTKIRIPVSENYLDEKVMGSGIYKILTKKAIVGTNKNGTNNNEADFVKQIKPILERKARLMFLLPGLPFKDQNILRIPRQYEADTPDLCEISFFVKLNNIVESIYQVCPYGTDIVILSDGELYADIFRIGIKKVRRYFDRVINYRNKLNFHGSISIINLKEMIDRASPNGEAWHISNSIKVLINSLLQSGDREFSESFDNLIQGMKWNLNSREMLKHIPLNICYNILKGKVESLPMDYHETWEKIQKIAKNAAVEYCSRNLMLRWTELMRCYFPESIRATMHAKRNQFALSSDYFPWNGVAFSEKWPERIDDVKVMPYYSIANNENLKLIYFKDSDLPCCFTNSSHGTCNIDLAKKVMSGSFKPSDWGGFILRKFKESEYGDLLNLAQGDSNFSWTRIEESEEYWRKLFEFRKQHYLDYKFGVFGVWTREEKLIGQFGLQVLDKVHDEVEVVAFLGKEFTGKGIGTILMNHLLMQCKQVGLNTLYAVARLDNEVSQKFISKYSGRAVDMTQHYNYKGIKYKISI